LRSSKAPPREGKKMDEDEVSFLQPKEEKKEKNSRRRIWFG
jgi:hypothetical protein